MTRVHGLCRGVNYAKIIHWWDYCYVLCNGQRGLFNRDVHAMARVTASRASPRSLYARQVYTSPSPRLLMCTLSLLRVVLPPCAPRLKICLPAAMTSPRSRHTSAAGGLASPHSQDRAAVSPTLRVPGSTAMVTLAGANLTLSLTEVSMGSGMTLLLATHLYTAPLSVMLTARSSVAAA